MHSDLQFPFRYADAPRFHGMVICSNIRDWRGADHTFGVLESKAGYPKIKMERKPHEFPKPGDWLFDRPVVPHFSSWTCAEDRERVQEEIKAEFRFRPATRQECAGKTFAFLRDEDLKFAP
jgi:hypothetical protein